MNLFLIPFSGRHRVWFVLSLFVLILPMGNLEAQPIVPPAIPSPNATSLGLYNEMPVSFFTGVPQINIPLYEVKGNKIHLPISLSYHAGGLRPDTHPGWVGNGWTLVAGGAITRKVNGLADEAKNSFYGTQGWYYNYANLNNGTWSSSAKLSTSGVAYGQVLPPANPAGVQAADPLLVDVDTQPDEFDFTFAGYTGKFYLDQTGNWQVQSNKPLKVIFNASDLVQPFIATYGSQSNLTMDIADMAKTFGKFTLVDEAGNQYVFGSTDVNNSAIEFGDAMVVTSNYGASITASSWFLSSIISADGTETINLSYVRGPFTSTMGYSYTASAFTTPGAGAGCNPAVNNPGHGIYTGTIQSPVYLTSITMPAQSLSIDLSNVSATTELGYSYQGSAANAYGKIYNDAGIGSPYPTYFPSFYTMVTNPTLIPYFSTNTPPAALLNRFIWLQLNSLVVKSTATNQIVRKVNFVYNNTASQRLRLGAINVTGSDNSSIVANGNNYYAFSYNTTSLPDYLTIYGDHWGFNNANGSNTLNSSWPGSTFDFSIPRAPDPTGVQTQAEILTSISFPTGGKTSFYYEPNTYGSMVDRTSGSFAPVAQTGIAGGVRLKQMVSTDNFGTPVVKNYYYVKNYTAAADPASLPSSGVLDSKPQYSFTTTGTSTQGQTFTAQLIGSNSVVPVTSNSMGTYIGYSTVVESNADKSYTIYSYTNHDNGYPDQPAINSWNNHILSGYYPSASYYFERGQLTGKAMYTPTDQPVSNETTAYTLTTPTQLVNAVSVQSATVCSFNNIGAYSRAAYSFCYSPFLPTQQVSTVYASDGSGTSKSVTTNNTYDQYKNILTQQTVNAKGQTEVIYYTYPNTFDNGDPVNPYSVMVAMNNVSKPIQKISTVAGNIVSGEINTYSELGAGKVYNDGYYSYETASPVPYGTLAGISYSGGKLNFDGHFTKRMGINYDGNGNVSTLTKIGADPTSFLWDYNGEYPVAKVTNANNIYASGLTNNNAVTETMKFNIPYTLNSTNTQTVNLNTAGPVTIGVAYANNSVTGTSTINYRFIGSGFYTGNLCTASGGATGCGATASSVTLSNVPAGSNSLLTVVTAYTGGLNVYGYTITVQYPALQYAVVSAASDIAYTSFEANGKGNWVYTGTPGSAAAFTGFASYNLGQANGAITASGLTAATVYTLSYWTTSTTPLSISGTQSGYPIRGATTSTGWTYFEHRITGVTGVTVSGSSVIDELRLYPAAAQMTTYTYTPLTGMTSQCDVNNHVQYYEYDVFGRLKDVRDQDHNVLKVFNYQYQSNSNQ